MLIIAKQYFTYKKPSASKTKPKDFLLPEPRPPPLFWKKNTQRGGRLLEKERTRAPDPNESFWIFAPTTISSPAHHHKPRTSFDFPLHTHKNRTRTPKHGPSFDKSSWSLTISFFSRIFSLSGPNTAPPFSFQARNQRDQKSYSRPCSPSCQPKAFLPLPPEGN